MCKSYLAPLLAASLFVSACSEPSEDEGLGPCMEDRFSPNHSEDTAATLTVGESYDLTICAEEGVEPQWDYWSVDLEAGQWVTAIVRSDNEAIDVRQTTAGSHTHFYDKMQAGVAGSRGVAAWDRTVSSVTFQAPEAMAYEFHVARARGTQDESHNYRMELAQGCYVDADCGDGLQCNRQLLACLAPAQLRCGDDVAEPNNSDSTATTLPTDGTPLTGLTFCDQDFDRFAFAAEVGDSLEVVVDHDPGQAGSTVVYLLRDDGSVEASEARASHPGTIFRIPHVRGGAYQLLVDGVKFQASAVNYDISLTKVAGGCADDSQCPHSPSRERAYCAQDGACVGIKGRGDVAIGGLCDDDRDCVGGSHCALVGNVPANWICTKTCGESSQCNAVVEGAYCLPQDCEEDPLGDCLPPCNTDEACPPGLTCTDGRCGDCFDGACTRAGGYCRENRCVYYCEQQYGQND